MRDLLDIATWSAAAMLVVGMLLSGDKPAPEPPAPEPTKAFWEWTVTDEAPAQPEKQSMMDHPPALKLPPLTYTDPFREPLATAPAIPPRQPPVVTLVARGDCGCGCPDCTGKTDCPCDCPNCKCGKPPAAGRRPPAEPEEAMLAVDWCGSLAELKDVVLKEKKPGLLHVFMGGCPPCEAMERNVFPNRAVVDFIESSFVAAKIDKDSLSRNTRREWGLTSFPADIVIATGWTNAKRLPLTTNPQKYLANLREALKWNEAKKRERSVLRQRAEIEQPVIRYAEPVYYEPPPIYYGGACSGGGCDNGWGGGGGWSGAFYGGSLGGCSSGACGGGSCGW